MTTLTVEEGQRLEEARNLASSLSEYQRVYVGGEPYDYGYVGQTGYVIVYEPGERNMQDSIGVLPSKVSTTP